ncbi:tripartite tricarboxylate transporter substrate-binding protein [Aquabacterium sp. OR-4]|uniref:tripartite tricarboxylate transporter substrate-binding protein n=1 Tax=Aquabacterium sp. OR-4 TaxID=2978127 RepID=UPI0028C7C522|nr:tripartite tricarboxylate transporter substrate-binding protein [Aquabacterium sp. OR-4]MDT7839037.1 tripartite tricarboxylate transporter substrate-binding protein [Aquabacterium sp. OR-4]
MPDRRLALAAGLLALGPLCAGGASAQATRHSTRLLVGFPPGGTADVLARALQQRLPAGAEPLIVENKPGAGGRLAVAELKAAPADGRTVMVSADPILTIYPHVFRHIAYSTTADVLPLLPIASEPVGLAVGPMVPASVKTLADFLTWCRQHPKDASYTTAAAGTTMHFVGSQLAHASQVDLLHVPHRGGAAAVQDVMGGQIAATVTSMSLAMPHLGAGSTGKLRVLAIASARRSRRLPEVPTFTELGHPQIRADVYYGTYLKAGTPAPLLAQWVQQIGQAAQSAEMLALLDKLSLDPMVLGQPAFAALVRADLERWGPIVKASGYSADD